MEVDKMQIECACQIKLITIKYFIDVWCFIKVILFNLSGPKITELTNQDSS